MTYHRDGSPYIVTPGYARMDFQNFGWLTRIVGFPTGDGSGWEVLKGLADAVKLGVTMGHHTCELCGWDNPDYGNGEIWLRVGQQVVRMPRMIWHYVKEHRYALPPPLVAAVVKKQFTQCTDSDHKQELDSFRDKCTRVPYLRSVAKWKESRFKHLMAFSNATQAQWFFNTSYLRDGYYIAEMNFPPEYLTIRFEADPAAFPDVIEVTTVVDPSRASAD